MSQQIESDKEELKEGDELNGKKEVIPMNTFHIAMGSIGVSLICATY